MVLLIVLCTTNRYFLLNNQIFPWKKTLWQFGFQLDYSIVFTVFCADLFYSIHQCVFLFYELNHILLIVNHCRVPSVFIDEYIFYEFESCECFISSTAPFIIVKCGLDIDVSVMNCKQLRHS